MKRRTISAGVLGALVSGGMIAASLAPTAAVAAATPTVQVTPFAALATTGDSTVSVAVSNFPANGSVSVVECAGVAATSNSPADCDTSTLQTVPTDASGAATISSYTVKSSDYSDADQNTCDQFHPCLVVAVDNPLSPTVRAGAPVYFGPTVIANPATGLTSGQKTTVSVFGFTAATSAQGGSNSGFVAECSSKAMQYVTDPSKALGYCDTTAYSGVLVDSNGNGSVQWAPPSGAAYHDSQGGKCDGTHSCIIAVASGLDFKQFNFAPVSYASSVITPVRTHTALKPSKKTVKHGKKIKLTAITRPTKGAGAFGGKLIVTENGKKVGAFKESKSGVVKFSVKIAKKGRNSIVARFTGNKYFAGSTAHTVVKGK